MPDPFSHVARGDPYGRVLTADRINSWVDAARVTHGSARVGAGRPGDPIGPLLDVFVRNDTGADLPELSVLSIAGTVPLPAPPPPPPLPPEVPVAEPLEYLRRPILTGKKPVATTDPIVITTEPIKSGVIGHAVIQGVAVVDVQFPTTAAASKFAKPLVGVTNRLAGDSTGPVAVLWTDPAASGSTRRAVVLLGDAGAGSGVYTGRLLQRLTAGGTAVFRPFPFGQFDDLVVHCTLLRAGQFVETQTIVDVAWSTNLAQWEVIAAQCPTG